MENVPEYDYGRVVSIDAEAVGRPGQRRFRLMLRSSSQTAAIWMEKQQIAGVGVWLEEMCQRLQRERPTDELDVEPLPFADAFDIEFQATQVGLGYAEEEDEFTIHAFAAEASPGQMPSFRCLLSRGQARVLSRKIAAVVAAGRPLCPLCELPMDPDGHVCPRANGHRPAAAV